MDRSSVSRATRAKSLVLENAVDLPRAREEVFTYLSDIRNEREWSPTMQSVEMLTDGPLRAGSRYRAKWKGAPPNELECVEFDPPHRWVHVSESGMWRVVFEGRVLEIGSGSRLLTRMEITPKGVGRLLMPVFGRMMARQERANMRHIRRALDQIPSTA
jgi:uncharacterized protein YndB with AHSA1/START domain